MKNMKFWRTALVTTLVLTVMLSVTGGTIAWFTDSVESGSNIIKAGNLDVEMYWADGTKAVPAADAADWMDAATGAIFNYDLWEPGYTEVRHVKIANTGSLALKYTLKIVPTGEVSELADVIDVYYADPAVQVADRASLTDANKIGTLSAYMAENKKIEENPAAGDLLPGEAHTVTVALKMQESAGNEYQGLSIGSDFKLVLEAIQLSYEEDSFDETYDEGLVPGFDEVITNFDDYTALRGMDGNYVITEDFEADNYIYFGDVDVTLNLDDNTITAKNTSQYLFVAQGANGKLVIDGDGTVNCGKVFFVSSNADAVINGGTYNVSDTSDKGNFYVQNSGILVINDGQFISKDADTPILYCINGFIEINGGFFQNTANPKQALLGMGNNLNYINNQKITLRGGTFVNWNPMDSAFARPWTNPDVPALIVLDEGYKMISETQENGDVWYSVVPE